MTSGSNDSQGSEKDESETATNRDESNELQLKGEVNAERVDGGVFIPNEELAASSEPAGPGDDTENASRIRVASQRTIHSGPLPPPEQLREYGDVLEGLDERIVEMTEDQLQHQEDVERRQIDHRQKLQRDDQKADQRLTLVSMVLAFFVAAGALTVIAMMVIYASPIVAVVALILVLGILCVTFVVGRRYRSEEIVTKYLQEAGSRPGLPGEDTG